MLLKKCPNCLTYTLKDSCKKCQSKTIDPHYKFKKVKDAPKDSSKHFTKVRKKRNNDSSKIN